MGISNLYKTLSAYAVNTSLSQFQVTKDSDCVFFTLYQLLRYHSTGKGRCHRHVRLAPPRLLWLRARTVRRKEADATIHVLFEEVYLGKTDIVFFLFIALSQSSLFVCDGTIIRYFSLLTFVRLRDLIRRDIRPIMVFDGASLPAKKKTAEDRRAQRMVRKGKRGKGDRCWQ